jgi:hypothetical protein
MSTCPEIRTSTCCPSDGADIYDYLAGDNTTPPLPIVTCPADFNAWMTDDEYIIPDFTSFIEICAACQDREDLTITQEPPAGTIITAIGTVTIIITVTDPFGQVVTCSFIITINRPPRLNDDDDDDSSIPTFPPWVYSPFLFAYWSANDTLCQPAVVDEGYPCFRRTDLSVFFGNASPRHVTNAGGGLYSSETPLLGFPNSPGPIFNYGSLASNNSATGYWYRADDATLRLIGASFTLRAFYKLAAMDAGESWQIAGKYDTVGYRIIIRRPTSDAIYTVTAELDNGATLLTVPAQPFTLNEWTYIAMAFDAAIGQLRFYMDGDLFGTDTSTGFVLTGEASQFRIGSGAIAGDPDVLSCFKLDDTSWEDSVGGRHLTATGTAQNVAGKISNAASFPQATGGRLSYGADSAFGVMGTDFSIRAWVRISSAASNPGQIIGKHNPGSGWKLNITGPAAPYTPSFTINGSTISFGAPSLSANTWYHIVATYKLGTTTARLYVDGVQIATGGLIAPTLSVSDFYIGIENSAVGPVQIDEVVIWDKELSAAKVVTDYNSGTGTSCPSNAAAADVYIDEVGLWLQAWSDARVADDYAIMEPYLT